MDREDERASSYETADRKKRQCPLNTETVEREKESVSTSTKKMESGNEMFVDSDPSINYRIVNLLTVFTVISEYVKCKTCDGDVNFKIDSEQGLGFKILLQCGSCPEKVINSCPLIWNTLYEINRRFIFALRTFGIGLQGAAKFCALMDLPGHIAESFYDSIMTNIHNAAKEVYKDSLKRSVKEEQRLTARATENEQVEGLTVCNNTDNFIRKDFYLLHGVTTVIGYYSKKVLDTSIRAWYCEGCYTMKRFKGTAKYENWFCHHQCSIKKGSLSVKEMTINGLYQMFKRSVQLYNTKYVNYVCHDDNEIYKAIVNSKPYGNNIRIKKKQCINFIIREFGFKLRKCKKEKHLDGRDMLTMELIDELTDYYGHAIRRHNDSIENMYGAIWATYYHKCSTDENPQHEYCPKDEDSWCKWQRAKVRGDLEIFKHQKELHPTIQEALKPIYEDFTKQELLETCVGGFNLYRHTIPKLLFRKIVGRDSAYGTQIIEIAQYIATCIFNDGFFSLLKIMNILNISVGTNAIEFCKKLDNLFEEDIC